MTKLYPTTGYDAAAADNPAPALVGIMTGTAISLLLWAMIVAFFLAVR